MIGKYPLFRLALCIIIMATAWFYPLSASYYDWSSISLPCQPVDSDIARKENEGDNDTLNYLNNQLISFLQNDDLINSRIIVGKILKKINITDAKENDALSSTYYLTGIFYLKSREFSDAVKYLTLSAGIKEQLNNYDERYARILYNLGVAYYSMGDYANQEHYALMSLEIEKKLFGESSPLLIESCNLLSIACLGLQEYEKSLEFSKFALNISNLNSGATVARDLMALYNNLGVTYIHLADYSKAKVYLEKTESVYILNHVPLNEDYLSLYNNMAITYEFLGLSDKSDEYYEKGIKLAYSINSSLAYNYIISYAITLGNRGNSVKGEALLRSAMERAKREFGVDSPVFFYVLSRYAEYLMKIKKDNKQALEYYRLCIGYLGKNNRNLFLEDHVFVGYALSLAENGETSEALSIIQSLLYPGKEPGQDHESPGNLYENPDLGSLKADQMSLRILQSKYIILWKLYGETKDIRILETASSTAKLIVEILEKVRINITEEDSRLILGDRYRESYINAIRDFNLLYNQTGRRVYLDEAFEYSEKSKVAGLLTATRELNASHFNIPENLSELERKLKRDIGLMNAKIEEETIRTNPDTSLINSYKENILRSSLVRDSLVAVFEKRYPGYFTFKYNTSVEKLSDLPGMIGRNANYINYVLSDTMLYIFVANRKKSQLLAFPADSSLYADIREFRLLLGMPSPSDNARSKFDAFQKIGYRLYQKIFEPLRPYLISKKLLISPDNILSYIPFETIPTAPASGDRIMYNKIPYLMNEFDISYTYSVTFLAESMKQKSRFSNKLIAFAPSYTDPIDVGTVLMNRQIVDGVLPELPYARQEAEYVSSLTGGTLYENNMANESVFKNESGKYDIIHLAMHTILNDKDPMYSTLIFSPESESADDRYLKTYEIYSIPLRAKMVVLSSCNSGTGYLFSGEGILSLARGFMYSGSKSVVMAMWEIEDRSGTEIVEGFYNNLKKGFSKSSALRRARIKYLEKSDQLRSHPYFWSALVVYGNNTPLYYPWSLIFVIGSSCIIILGFVVFYFRRRKNS
jgi:CHAT domain-containing protein